MTPWAYFLDLWWPWVEWFFFLGLMAYVWGSVRRWMGGFY